MKSSGDGSADIPAAAKKVVQNLKEIVKNHSDEEIYATLKECGMDPNHAVYILLNQDTFHEVKRKRDKRRENGLNNAKEETKSRSMLASSKRFDAGGTKVNYVPRHSQSGGSVVGNQKLSNAGEDAAYEAYRDTNTTSQIPTLAKSKAWRIRVNTGARGLGQRVSSQTNAPVQRYGRRGARVSGYPISSMQNRPSNSIVAAKTQVAAAPQADRAKREDVGGHGNEVGPADVSLLKSIPKSFPSASHRNMVSEAKNLPGRFRETSRPYAAQSNSISATGWARAYSQNYRRIKAPYQTLPGAHRVPNGLAWKPKPSTVPVTAGQGSHGVMEDVGSLPSPRTDEVPREAVAKFEGLKLRDERPVIIPEHLQVPEAECAGLNFGSFDTEFELRLNETKNLASVESPISSEVCPVHQVEASVAESPLVQTSTPSHSQLLSPAPVESFATASDDVLSLSAVAPVRSPEIAKPEVPAEQGRQFSPTPFVATYQGLGAVPQPPYIYDTAESQPQEIQRAANVVQPPLADAAPNYYAPVFRPSCDVETRYPFLSSHGASKFSGNVPLMNGQTLPPSQEPSQNAGSTLAVGQPQSIPVHAYAAQPANVTMPPYAYGYHPYVPSNYAYVHAPYGSSGYPQPVGSNFTSGARGYPSTGTAPIKYPLSQYKLGTGNSPHAVVAAAYGNYGTAFSGFAGMNSAVSAGSGSNYDNMAGSHYKENTLFPPSHQVEGSALWVQGPLSRDASGIQSNSYYNLQGQGQHAGYTPSQPTHVTGFAGYNRQSTPVPNTHHQVLQQPQAVGSLGAAPGSQGAVIFSQPQGGPVNWASSYSNLLRGQ